MIIDIILIIALFVMVVLYMNAKQQLKIYQSEEKKFSRKPPHENEEFSLGLTNLNSDFSTQVSLDPLTGLTGRIAFEDRLTQAINQSKRFEKTFAVLLLDIQEFKHVNGIHGYEMGDKILKEAANRLKNAIRQIDTITRYAGNTFIVMLPQLAMPETAAYVAQRLLDAIDQPFHIDNKEINLSSSVGVAIFPLDGNNIKSLLINANKALEQAKKNGKSRYQFFQQELHTLGQRELAIHAFISQEDLLQKLDINYQPQVDVVKDEIANVQAMISVEIPDIGKVLFKDFAKIATNCKKITEIGEWTFKTALLQFKQWQINDFKPSHLALQMTLKQIENQQFIYKITQLLEEHNISPKQIIFEITEQNLFANTNEQENSFYILSQLGIQIALSISALGQFALQRITKLPVNYLKLESKLLEIKQPENENESIIHMIVSLAKDMNITIIADGVDTPKQKYLFEEMGCELMQGKVFGNSLPNNIK